MPGAEDARSVGTRVSPAAWCLAAAAAVGLALLVYGPALRGNFLSDDLHYVALNRHVHELDLRSVAVLFDPTGPATIGVVNYAPLQLLLHAAAWQAFGPEPRGHHVLNVVLHASASVLLAALLLQCGVPPAAAGLGAALFLLHPANVEAVAWISQLKSSLALALSLAGLLAWRRHPLPATLLFVAALLAKPTAAFALPVAALLDRGRGGPVRWRWLAVWAVCFGAYAVVEFATHQRSGAADASLHAEPLLLLRTIAALGARYLWMAATSLGVSAFHEPEPARSLLDPWWLAALPLAALLGWRLLSVWRRRRIEAAWWVWAAVSFAPVSQVFPFLYPMADRYLYFILPGLLGGSLLALGEVLDGLAPATRRRASAGLLVAGTVLAIAFGLRSHERAGIWRANALVLADAARHYPVGVPANLLRAKRAAQVGDAGTAVAALRAAADRGYNRYEQLETDPGYASVREAPGFRALVREMAAGWIERGQGLEDPTQTELRGIAHAHVARGEAAPALAALERALEVGGPADAEIAQEIAAVRAAVEAGAIDRLRLGVGPPP